MTVSPFRGDRALREPAALERIAHHLGDAGLRVDIDRVTATHAVGAESAELRRVLLRVLLERGAVLGGGEPVDADPLGRTVVRDALDPGDRPADGG